MKAPNVMEGLTPKHIDCAIEEIADTVIMPGDPLRAKYIAEIFLEQAKLVSSTRNMYAYTGFYKNKRVTIMGSGMGMPSMGIYAFELFYFFGVEKIIRIGTCGAHSKDLHLRDIVLASESYTEGNFAYSYNGDPTHFAYPSKSLNEQIIKTAEKTNKKVHVGTVMTTEQFDFYSDIESILKRVPEGTNLIAGEMESFALFHIASSLEKAAACLITVVDSKHSTDFMSIEDREKSLNDMFLLALDTVSEEEL